MTGRLSPLCVGFLLFVVVGCSSQPVSGRSERRGDNQSTAAPRASDKVQEVLYDHVRPEKPPLIKIQVLVDTSASMRGFKSQLPALLHAVDEGVSYSRGLYFNLDSKRTCFFDQKRGIFGCQPKIDGVPIVDASGYTNLDRAVQTAGDYGLSVIFTDGVPSGLSSGKECVGSGVDAACVSEALAGVLRGMPGSPATNLRGFWFVPVITMYDGLFFAEQPIKASDFQANRAEASVQQDIGVNARIEKPRTGTDGTLLFDYHGPRMLLALVVGEVEPGRAFLQEFFAHTDFSRISTLNDMKSYKSGTALLPAVEVFPSTISSQQFGACRQSTDVRGRIEGDLINCAVKATNQFRLSCRPKPSRGRLLLSATEPANPLHFDLLAPSKVGFSGRGEVKNLTLGAKSKTGNALSLLVADVSCNSREKLSCGTPEARVELTSTPDLELAANELSSSTSGVGNYIHKLATNEPALEPHKVYGLADLLQNFYHRKLPAATSTFAALEFCEE